jgi:type VI secretion system protein VasG
VREFRQGWAGRDRIGRRIRENHDATFFYDDAVVEHIASMCHDPDTALSREFLKRSLAREALQEAQVILENGDFGYKWA